MIQSEQSEFISIEERSRVLFEEQRQSLFRRTDRLFAVLMVFQWLAGIAIALLVSPRTWIGSQSTVHIHVWAALFLGGAIAALPVYLACHRPGELITRHVIAVSQMLFSALLIHLTGGRIESHFHIFGSLAFLAVYNDWRLLVTASVVVIADHVLRGIFWPQSVYGVLSIEPLRWIEHAWWVVFEDVFLIKVCLNNVAETHNLAQRQAEVEDTGARVEEAVKERTLELRTSERILSTQYAVNRVLAVSNSFSESAAQILRAIAINMMNDFGGESSTVYGEIWQLDSDGLLKCTCNIQLLASNSVEPFHDLDYIQFSPEVGLPGRVFSTRSVIQIADISSDERFLRREPALRAGFRSAFGFPVIEGNEATVVISFLTDSQRIMTNDERSMLESLGQQIGQFIVRKRIENDNVQLANIVSSSNDAIIGQTSKGVITTWNRGAEKLFGYTVNQAIGRDIVMLIPEDQLNEMENLTVSGQSTENFETVLVGKDRKRKDVSIASSPIVDADSNVLGSSIIARDITERKEAERRVSEFYSTVSHELRTPLTSIRGALGLIGGGVIKLGTDESMELIEIAMESSDRLIRLINDILDLKKIEVGKFELAIETLNSKELANQVLAASAGIAEQEKIKLNFVQQEGGERFYGDRDRCIQVLTNLVSNAIKFSSAGSDVTVSVGDGAPGMVRFSISDTGPGIPPEKIPMLFDKFKQLDSSDTRVRGGTGLGLAISKALVEEHGGTIGLHSAVGIGTTFWFELSGAKTTETQSSVYEDSTQYAVLIVEDDEQLAQVLSVNLSAEGIAVTVVESAQEAQHCLARSTPAVIVIADSLSERGGAELLEHLDREPRTRNIPVIVITANGANDSSSYSPVIVDLLVKPFETNQLLRAIERAVSLPSRSKSSIAVNPVTYAKSTKEVV